MNNMKKNKEYYSNYLKKLNEELKFLWREAHETVEGQLKERKLTQYWQMYRLYRSQRDYFQSLFS